MEQRLVDINKIKEVTLEDSIYISIYTPDNGVRCYIEADTVLTIPENPTNGDIIKALFPNMEWRYDTTVYRYFNELYDINFSLDWWDAPYTAPHKEAKE